ncbi:MAG: DNA-3-methyladenine glycosylase [Candidatus Pacearchaeota archaeon]
MQTSSIYFQRLGRSFYMQPTLKAAKELLGKYFVRNYKGKLLVGKIVETEAYIGPDDKASHAYSKKIQTEKEKLKVIKKAFQRISNYVDNKEKFILRLIKGKGKVTYRNIAEYLKGGHIYIYLIYGNYYQCNVTTSQEGVPECVLIRAAEPISNFKGAKGPGLFCTNFKLDASFYGEDLCKSKRVWLAEGEKIKPNQIVATKRIGIEYAMECKNLPWRFYIKDNPWVSKK